MKKRQLVELFFAVVLISAAFFCVNAQSGGLDPSFGSGGIVTGSVSPGSNYLNKVAVQQLPPYFEPKLVVAVYAHNMAGSTVSDFYALRYNPDGSIDPTFGSGGVARVAITPLADNEVVSDLAVQSDGKIVLAGRAAISMGKSTIYGVALTRLNSDGSLDTSFGNNGRVLFNFANNVSANAGGFALDSYGNIVVVGDSGGFAVARLLPNGNFDTSFNGSGKTIISLGKNASGSAGSVKIQQNGGIVVGGWGRTTPNNSNFAVIRLNPVNGSLDPTFGGSGVVFTDFFGKADVLTDLAIDGGGNIVAVGYAQNSSGNVFSAARYLSTGQLDSNFNGSGKFVAESSGYSNLLHGVEIDGLGRIIAVGERRAIGSNNPSFAVLRLNPNGTFDQSFGGTGMIFTSITGRDNATTLAIQPNGRIVVGGYNNGGQSLTLARYLP